MSTALVFLNLAVSCGKVATESALARAVESRLTAALEVRKSCASDCACTAGDVTAFITVTRTMTIAAGSNIFNLLILNLAPEIFF